MTALALVLSALLQAPATPASAAPRPDPWPAVVDRTLPAVVSIRSRIRVAVGRDEVGPFEGTGFVVALEGERGLVATNRHVAGDGVVPDCELRFFDGRTAPAWRLHADPLHDFAFLWFDRSAAPDGIVPIPLSARTPAIGEAVRMIGNNGGLAATVLGGIVSNLEAAWDEDPGVPYLQTAIASSGGSSGSPLLDGSGAAIGLQTAHDTRTSYAIPGDYVAEALAALREGRRPARGTLGLRLRRADLDEATVASDLAARPAGLPASVQEEDVPALVEGVVPGSPAEGAVVPGEVVLAIGGVPAGSMRRVERLLNERVGTTVQVVVARGGGVATLALPVADLGADVVDRLVLFGGAGFHDVAYEIRSRTDLPRAGVFVADVAPGSAAEGADLRRDDVVLTAGGRPLGGVDDLWRALGALRHGDRVLLVVRRPSSFDSATRTVMLGVDRVWDPVRRLLRSERGWVDASAEGAPGPAAGGERGAVAPSAAEERVAGSVSGKAPVR